MNGNAGNKTTPEKTFAGSDEKSSLLKHVFIELNKAYEIKYLNASAVHFFKKEKKKLIGKPLVQVFPKIRFTQGYEAIIQANTKKLEVEVTYTEPPGNQVLNLLAQPTADGVCVFFSYSLPLTSEEQPFNLEDQYRSLVENTPDIITRWSKDLKLLYANKALGAKTGIENEFAIGKNIHELGEPDEITIPWTQTLQKIFATGEPSIHHTSLLTANGLKSFQSSLVPERNAVGEIQTILSIGRDITELKKADDDLRAQLNLTKTLTETIPDVVTIIELPSRKILYINKDSSIISGFTEEEVKSMSFEERNNSLVHPEDRLCLADYYNRMDSMSDDDINEVEYRFKHKDESWHTLSVRGKILKRDEKGLPVQAIQTGNDITARVKAEQELLRAKDELAKQATSKYLSLFNAIDAGFCILKVIFDKDGKPVDFQYVETNPVFEKQSGITNVINRTFREVLPEAEPLWIEIYGRIVQTRVAERFEGFVEQVDKWFELYAFCIDELEDNHIAVLFNDITERKRIAETLRKDNEKRAFLLNLIDALRPLRDPVAIQETAMGLLGSYLQVNRAYYAEAQPDDNTLTTQTGYWKDVSPMFGPRKFSDFSLKMRETYLAGKTIVVNDLYTDLELDQKGIKAFENIQFRAGIGVPLVKEGKLIAIVAVHQSVLRQWKEEEITLLEEIAERTWAAVERAKAESAVRKSEEHQRYLLHLNDAIRPITDPVELEGVATLTAMNYFDTDRCYYCEVEGDNAIIKRDASKGDLPSVAGTYPLSSFAIFKKVVDEGLPFVVHNASTSDILDEPLRALCLALQVISFVDIPVVKNGKVVGVLCLVQSTPRNWTETEVELAAETAERVWAAVDKAKIVEELRRREAELSTVQEIGGVGGFDVDVVNSLRSWRSAEYIRLHGLPADTTLEQHEDWLNRLHSEDRERANTTLQEALASGSNMYISEYRIIRPNDKQTRWILAKGHIQRDENGKAIRLMGAHIDITTRKIAEEVLRQSEEEKAYLLKLSDAIRLLDNPDEIRLGAAFVLGEHLKADRAFYMEIIRQNQVEYYVINETYHTEKAPRRIGQFPTENFGRIVDKLRLGHNIVVNTIENDPLVSAGEMAKYATISTYAFVIIPLIKNGQLIAALAVHQATPRVWKDSEIKLIEETAERTWASVERARAEEALLEAKESYLTQLEQEVNERTAELKESQSLLQSVFDSSLNAINVAKVVRDKAGKIIDFEWVLVNSKANEYAPDVDFIGRKYTEIYPGLKSSLAFERYKKVAETGKSDDFESYYKGEGLKGWYRNIVVKFGDGLLITTENITERKKAELEIKENKNLLQSIMHNTSSSIMALKAVRDNENKIIDLEYVFTNSQTLISVNRASLVGKRFLKEFPDESTDYLFKQYAYVIENGKDWRGEVRVDVDGSDVWAQVFATRLNGWCLVTYSDITLIKKTEQEFKRNRDLFQATLESSLNLVQVFEAVRNKEGTIVDFQWMMISRFTEDILGKVTGRKLLQLFPEAKESGLFKKLVNVLYTGKADFFEMYFDGNKNLRGWYESVAVQLNDGVVLTSRNITERKIADEEIRKTLAILQQSEKIAQMGSWEYNIASGDFIWSDGMYELFGLEKGVKVTPGIYRQYAIEEDSDIAEDLIDSIAYSHRGVDRVLRINKNGSTQILKINSVVLVDTLGLPEKILGVDLNITELIRSEEQLRLLNSSITQRNKELEDKNAELASFAFIASHDLKEPLRKITVFSNMLDTKESQSLSVMGKEYLTRIKSAVKRMDLLIEDILSLSRLQSRSQLLEQVDLNDVLQKTKDEYAEQMANVEATIESDKLPTIQGAASPLFYLFNNLISNALKFQREGNKPYIRISVSLAKGSDIVELSDRQEEEFYKISFADNGIGFDNVHARQIFQIFKRLHGQSEFPGTGIGLTICKKIMDIHHGYIASHSQINNGTVFTCYFPVNFQPVSDAERDGEE
ncbi:PAS domain-containing protein [Emticicia sp. C21]|uniref:PAS domain-containing protein n=1 Tax=Emticicia sp. C21 TaxID=2302915 RepID=UPI000E351380|nr:PAS domain-containing protein [Emticicia sp. C21]RFS17433.1 PAS domain S-box protein [Emticicia sp. C21]